MSMPPEDDALLQEGLAHHQRGALDLAELLYRRVLAADKRNAEALHLLGVVQHQRGRTLEAIEWLSAALAVDPENAAYHSNLAAALIGAERYEAAAASARAAIAGDPQRADAHANLGNALRRLGCHQAAAECFRAAIALRPDFASFRNNLGNTLQEMGHVDAALAELRAVVALQPGWLKAHSDLILTLNYRDGTDPAELLAEAARFGEAAAARAGQSIAHKSPQHIDGQPLRVGLVSGNFRRHAVSQFLEGVLGAMDPGKVRLFAYSTVDKEDEVTARLRAIVPHWRSLAGKSDAAAARSITEDGIHVLVDLAGHTGHNRLPLFALRPAPVAATWLGYSGTTGLPAIDYIICDRHVLPPGEEHFYSETAWRLPDVYLCFTPPSAPATVGPPPALAGGGVTFGSFNNLNKVGERTIACWARLLQTVPGSRLVLKSPTHKTDSAAAQVTERFARHGLSADRLTVLGRIEGVAAHLEAYNLIDIALDPFPYNGTTTTCEALWMGTPVLGIRGDRFIARVGESLLSAVDLDGWIADGEADYVRRGAALAADLAELERLNRGLRSRLLASPLTDAKRFATNLEAAFLGMWGSRGARQGPGR